MGRPYNFTSIYNKYTNWIFLLTRCLLSLIFKAMTTGMIFDIKRYSINDGPGIRTTVFLKGCPLDCWWCHNPESKSLKSELMYRANRCTLCAECVDNCPLGAISLNGKANTDRTVCDN